MKQKILILMLLAFFIPSLAFAYKDCNVRFKDITGDVAVRPDDEDDDSYVGAEFETVLHYKDRIKTEEDSEAILGLADKTSFIIKEKSILVLPEYEGEISNIKMVAGIIWINMKKSVNGGELRLHGTQAVAGIRGSALRASTDGVNDFFSLSHGSSYITINDTKEVIKLKPGEQIKVAPKGKYELKKANVSELNKELKKSMENLGKNMDNSEIINEIKQNSNDIKRGSNELKNSLRKLQNRGAMTIQTVYSKSSRLSSRVAEAEIIMNNAKSKAEDKNLSKAISELNKAIGEAKELVAEVANLAGYEVVEEDTEETNSNSNNDENTETDSIISTNTTANNNEDKTSAEDVIDSGVLDSLKDLEAELTSDLSLYNTYYDEYKDAVSSSAKTKILSRSLRIIGKFARISRRYDRAKKLYSSTYTKLARLKSADSQKQELEDLWRRIDDLYSSLSNEADRLRDKIEDLQNQLNRKGILEK